MGDISLIILTEYISSTDNLSYNEIPIQVLDRQVPKLRTKKIASNIVLWRNLYGKQATWEGEKDINKGNPHLFEFREITN